MGTISCLITHILQNIFFVFNRKNKLIQVWKTMRVSKWRHNYYFVVNCSFKLIFYDHNATFMENFDYVVC